VTKKISAYLDRSLQLLKGRPLHRKSVAANSETSHNALEIWLARVLQESAEQRTQIKAKFNIADTSWLKQLAMLSVYPDGPIRAAELLREKGILLVVESQLPHTLLDGAALLFMDSIPVIGMTLRHDRLDNFWFTLFHELGHVFLHFNHGLKVGFVDDLDGPSLEKAELDADSFAQSHLLPDEVWNSAPARFSKSSELVVSFAKARNIHPAVVAGRIRRDRNDYRIFGELLGRGQVRRLFLQTA
jgi:HTH-type transcriptional regulator/antitoxin HigA